jgi:uncharacterized membrane protein YGL010W
MAAGVEALWEAAGCKYAWLVAVGIQALAWSGQVGIGHKLIEGNNPGMASQLTAASVVLSPLLAFYDVVWAVGARGELRSEILELMKEG